MSKKLAILLLFIFLFFLTSKPALATENPLAVANNKIGIHILNTSELQSAAQLINSNGGDWGYVTIPIQTGDQNQIKWQNFMNDCKKYHVIPIIRLATNDDAANSKNWRKPDIYDIINFANFLNSLDWPTKNRYVIIFNEVNRGDEWGGNADAAEYAKLLSFTDTVFKSANPDFFIISAGLDNAAPDQGNIYINEYTYLTAMNQAVPGIFNQIDGISSHAYPNPGFAQPPDATSPSGVGSFIHERTLISTLSSKVLPVFITETGWASPTLNDDQIVQYYNQTFSTIWNDADIVAVTPFLLQAGAGPFNQFSFLSPLGDKTKEYQFLYHMQKVKGVPSYPTHIIADTTKKLPGNVLADNTINAAIAPQKPFLLSEAIENAFTHFFH